MKKPISLCSCASVLLCPWCLSGEKIRIKKPRFLSGANPLSDRLYSPDYFFGIDSTIYRLNLPSFISKSTCPSLTAFSTAFLNSLAFFIGS